MAQIKVQTDTGSEMTIEATRQNLMPGQWRTIDTRAKIGEPVTVSNGLGLHVKGFRIAQKEKEQMDIQKVIGAGLKEARQSRSLTQSNVADKASTSLKYIQYVEQGKKNITIKQLWRIAEAMGCNSVEIKIR